MDTIIMYFIPFLLVVAFSLLPIYFIRMVYFVKKNRFVDEVLSLNLSLYIHIFVYSVFIITLFFYTPIISELSLFIFGYAMIVLLIILLGYRQRFQHIKRNKFIVLFSRYNNRELFQQLLQKENCKNIDINDGAFSFVTRLKFNQATYEEVDNRLSTLNTNTALFHSFTTLKGYALFALNTALFFGSIVAFIVFFVNLPNLVI